ncbi:MAG: disulfide bond formation protein B [Sphingomonadales bacterium]|nr:disulfide bond formation protein B [Sphingomonadales bacterium]
MNKIFNIAHANAPLALGLAALGLLMTAWTFQYGFGYEPCELCYTQRQPYYYIVPLGLFGWMADRKGSPFGWHILLLITGLFLLNAGIAAYHAGVEYKWWEGPNTCTPNLDIGANYEDILAAIEGAPVVRCDAAAWTLFGISMAGYNFVAATVLGLFGLKVLSDRKK